MQHPRLDFQKVSCATCRVERKICFLSCTCFSYQLVSFISLTYRKRHLIFISKIFLSNALSNTQATPKQHPSNTQATPKQHPSNTQATPKQHPSNTQATPKQHPSNTQATHQAEINEILSNTEAHLQKKRCL